MSQEAERRRDRRHSRSDLDVEVNANGRWMLNTDCNLQNISRGGMRLQLSGDTSDGDVVGVGQVLDVRLALPSGPLLLPCEVRWVSPDYNGTLCGISFRDIGFFDAYRLGRCLTPDRVDLLAAADRALPIATAGVLLMVVLRRYNFEFAGLRDLWNLELPPPNMGVVDLLTGMLTPSSAESGAALLSVPTLACAAVITVTLWLLSKI